MDFAAALAVLQQRTKEAPASGAAPGLVCSECADDGSALEHEVKTHDTSGNDLSAQSTESLVRAFLQRQEERVGVYRRFDEGFLRFLQVPEAGGYEALSRQTTAAFATISSAINAVEAELRTRGAECQGVVASLRAVQELEREKLQLTAQIHIVRHGQAVDALHSEYDHALDPDSTEDLSSDVNAANSKAARAAVLRDEEAAELRRRLAELTDRLNEALEEVRCELCEMAGTDAGMDAEAP